MHSHSDVRIRAIPQSISIYAISSRYLVTEAEDHPSVARDTVHFCQRHALTLNGWRGRRESNYRCGEEDCIVVGGEWKIGMSWDADACGSSCYQMIDGTRRVGVRSGRVAGGDEHRNHETTCVWSRSTGKLSMAAGMVIFFFFGQAMLLWSDCLD